jgi:hypothetical protein
MGMLILVCVKFSLLSEAADGSVFTSIGLSIPHSAVKIQASVHRPGIGGLATSGDNRRGDCLRRRHCRSWLLLANMAIDGTVFPQDGKGDNDTKAFFCQLG